VPTPRSGPGSGPPSERNRLLPAGGAPTTPPSHLRPIGRKPTTRAWATRRPGERESKARVISADDCYHHSAGPGTAALVPGARPLLATKTATQAQERLRDALMILHVSRAQKRRLRPMLPVSCTRRGHEHTIFFRHLIYSFRHFLQVFATPPYIFATSPYIFANPHYFFVGSLLRTDTSRSAQIQPPPGQHVPPETIGVCGENIGGGGENLKKVAKTVNRVAKKKCMFNIVQISAFLISKDRLLKCVGLKVMIFKCLRVLLTLVKNLKSFCKFNILTALPQTLIRTGIA
jgi:hypothetical protein